MLEIESGELTVTKVFMKIKSATRVNINSGVLHCGPAASLKRKESK